MTTTADRFDSFLSNVRTDRDDMTDAQAKFRGVVKKLHSHYYGSFYDGSTAKLIGSYGKGTTVKPPRDVDILFIMPFDQFSRYDSYLGNGQSQLLQDVKKILQQRYTTTDGMRGDGQVVVVPFKGGHTVELLPAWKLTSGKYYVPNTHDGGSWKTVDHNAEIGNVDNSDNNSKGNTRDLIRMMKIWQAECSVPIKSLTLELRTVNFLKSWPHRGNSTMYYDWMVRDFFSELVKNANNYCVIPGIDERCYYGDTWLSRAESAHGRALKACDYESSGKYYAAVAEWQKIFGSQFDY